MPDLTNELLTNEVEAPTPKKGKQKLTKDQLDAFLATMYGRALTEVEVDALLTNTTQVTLAYHSVYGGLDIIDYDTPMTRDGKHILISFSGLGNLDIVESEKLLTIFTSHPLVKAEILQLFSSGILTLEAGNIKRELYSQYYKNQPNNSLNNTNMKTDDGAVMKNDFILN